MYNYKITRKGSQITVRKKVDVHLFFMLPILLVFVVALIFIAKEVKNDIHRLISIIVGLGGVILLFFYEIVKLCYVKIIFDDARKKITFFTPFKHVRRYSDVNHFNLQSAANTKRTYYKTTVVILFKSGKAITIRNSSEYQAKEIIEIIKQRVFPTQV